MSLDEDIAILFDNNIPTVDVNINDAVKYALDQRMGNPPKTDYPGTGCDFRLSGQKQKANSKVI